MIALMTSTLMAATVGLAISMSVAGTRTSERTIEKPVAASFFKYKNAVECWAAMHPGEEHGFLSPAELKATIGPNGAPCAHDSFVNAVGINTSIRVATVYTFIWPTTVRGTPAPAFEVQRFYGMSGNGGVVQPDGQVRTIDGRLFPNDMSLPAGAIVYWTPRT